MIYTAMQAQGADPQRHHRPLYALPREYHSPARASALQPNCFSPSRRTCTPTNPQPPTPRCPIAQKPQPPAPCWTIALEPDPPASDPLPTQGALTPHLMVSGSTSCAASSGGRFRGSDSPTGAPAPAPAAAAPAAPPAAPAAAPGPPLTAEALSAANASFFCSSRCSRFWFRLTSALCCATAFARGAV